MNSYENVLAKNAEVPKNELEEDFEKRELGLISEMMKSLNYLIDRSQFIQRHADKINPSSAKLFIGSFLNDINEIKMNHEFIKSYFEVIAKLHNISSEKDKNDSSIRRGSRKKDTGDKENGIENIPEIMDIKSELKKITVEIISKSNGVKGYLKNMKENGNNDSFIAGAHNSFKGLNDAILKLDSIEKMIAAYSE